MSTIILSCSNYSATPQSHWFDAKSESASTMERMLMTAQYATATIAQANRLNGNEERAAHLQKVSDTFGDGRTIIGIIRLIFCLHDFFSGSMFYERYTQADVDANPTLNIKAGAFKKATVDGEGKIYYTLDDFDNKIYTYVNDDEEGAYLRRDWLDVLGDVLVLAARILSALTFSNKFKVINIGHHAPRINNTISGLWSVVISVSLVSSVRSLIHAAKMPQDEGGAKAFKKQVTETIVSVLDVATIAFDTFGVAAAKSTRPEIALAGTIICTIAPFTSIAKKIYFAK